MYVLDQACEQLQLADLTMALSYLLVSLWL